jgi:hypothetical protein
MQFVYTVKGMVVGQQVVVVVGQQVAPIELDWQPLFRGSKKGVPQKKMRCYFFH